MDKDTKLHIGKEGTEDGFRQVSNANAGVLESGKMFTGDEGTFHYRGHAGGFQRHVGAGHLSSGLLTI